jgi:hypothetical protein
MPSNVDYKPQDILSTRIKITNDKASSYVVDVDDLDNSEEEKEMVDDLAENFKPPRMSNEEINHILTTNDDDVEASAATLAQKGFTTTQEVIVTTSTIIRSSIDDNDTDDEEEEEKVSQDDSGEEGMIDDRLDAIEEQPDEGEMGSLDDEASVERQQLRNAEEEKADSANKIDSEDNLKPEIQQTEKTVPAFPATEDSREVVEVTPPLTAPRHRHVPIEMAGGEQPPEQFNALVAVESSTLGIEAPQSLQREEEKIDAAPTTPTNQPEVQDAEETEKDSLLSAIFKRRRHFFASADASPEIESPIKRDNSMSTTALTGHPAMMTFWSPSPSSSSLFPKKSTDEDEHNKGEIEGKEIDNTMPTALDRDTDVEQKVASPFSSKENNVKPSTATRVEAGGKKHQRREGDATGFRTPVDQSIRLDGGEDDESETTPSSQPPTIAVINVWDTHARSPPSDNSSARNLSTLFNNATDSPAKEPTISSSKAMAYLAGVPRYFVSLFSRSNGSKVTARPTTERYATRLHAGPPRSSAVSSLKGIFNYIKSLPWTIFIVYSMLFYVFSVWSHQILNHSPPERIQADLKEFAFCAVMLSVLAGWLTSAGTSSRNNTIGIVGQRVNKM